MTAQSAPPVEVSEEDIVRAIYRGILKREPAPEYLERRSARLKKDGVATGITQLIQEFLQTDEYHRTQEARGSTKLLFNSSHVYLQKINEEFAKSVPAGSLVLDAGAGLRPYRPLYNHARYESADLDKGSKRYGDTTYFCDLTHRIPVEDNRFDFIIFNQVLEHLKEPLAALKELRRVLNPGGVILCTCPLFYELHEEPYDFFRYTRYGLRHLFEQAAFEIEVIDWLEGFFGTCGYMLESIAKFAPITVKGASAEAGWANAFLSAFRFVASASAAMFYKMDIAWKITNAGFPKNYVIKARKPKSGLSREEWTQEIGT
jgi:SAM-dependent methyltransferase